MIRKVLFKNKQLIYNGAAMAALLLFLKWLEVKLLIYHPTLDLYIGIIALLFTGLGIWLTLKIREPKTQTIIIEKEIYIQPKDEFQLNKDELIKSGISKRELEVLQLIAQGFSNDEIASQLFVSLNTIKTHSSKLFEKLEVKRRTQAIDKAKKMGIIK